MYGPPANTELTSFRGRELIQVCIGAHDLILNFVGSVSVTVLSSIALRTGEAQQRYVDFRDAAAALVALMGRTIVAATDDVSGTLIHEFDSNCALSVVDDSRQHESYLIRHGSRLIVV